MTLFRPCIDLHEGRVKQLVGGTLEDQNQGTRVNFVSGRDAAWFAARYRDDGLEGGHVILLGPGNGEAAKRALAAWPGGLQVGGGIHAGNAAAWVAAGAGKVIVTSSLFDRSTGAFLEDAADRIRDAVDRKQIVIDLSCRRRADGTAIVAMNRWRDPTELELTPHTLDRLGKWACEFLIHAVEVEGLCSGMDEDLIRMLGRWGGAPVTYAGGARSLDDLHLVHQLSDGRVDLTIGSALDLFGGGGVAYDDCVAFNRRQREALDPTL